MPITLATLFCYPQDLWDKFSVEGVDLRTDDNNLASGHIITTTADAVEGATTLAVSALSAALLKGSQLTFDGAGMDAPVTVELTAAASAGATSLTVAALSANVGGGAQARDSGVNAATGARLLVGCRKGTSKVKLYCNSRYDDSQLALSGTVCDWATVVGSKFLATRRAQGCPKSIKEEYEEAIEEMRMVQGGQLSIEDIGTRGVDWPTIVNVTVNPGYDFMRSRVQRNISEQTPTGFGQFVDWNSAAMISW